MRLYILRHGKSPQLTEAKVRTDAERPLSEEGRQDARRMVRELHNRGGRPMIVLTSPLRRALQTAAEAAGLLKLPEPKIFDPLSNRLTGELLFDHLLRAAEESGDVLAVGHQPQLGELVSYATGKIVEIKPAGLVALETTAAGRAALLWSQNP